ncbi:hypothetical protein MY520_04460 [Geodermatophilus sp. CPCC 205506]
MDSARVRAELSVRDMWLRYLALGGTGDAFDLDGYLQGLVPLEGLQQDVLAQALNEALADRYRADCVPLSTPPLRDVIDERLDRVIEEMLGERPSSPRVDSDRGRPGTESS